MSPWRWYELGWCTDRSSEILDHQIFCRCEICRAYFNEDTISPTTENSGQNTDPITTILQDSRLIINPRNGYFVQNEENDSRRETLINSPKNEDSGQNNSSLNKSENQSRINSKQNIGRPRRQHSDSSGSLATCLPVRPGRERGLPLCVR